jgi:hypothetical protein
MRYHVDRALMIGSFNESQVNWLHDIESKPKITKEQAGRTPNYIDEFCRCVHPESYGHWCTRALFPWELRKNGMQELIEIYKIPDKDDVISKWKQKIEIQLISHGVFISTEEEMKWKREDDELNAIHSLDWKVRDLMKKGKLQLGFVTRGSDAKERIAEIGVLLLSFLVLK